MIAIFVILVFTVYLTFFFPIEPKKAKEEEKSPKYKAQMKKLWQISQTSMKERKPFRAEKALLTILKFDEKNAAAYNRLGILYAKGQKYDEAVECFEIAQSLDNNPASIHNAGLIYLETGAYEKAEMAFKQAIEMEGDVPARHIALAKAEEKLGKTKKAIESLENAYELDPKTTTLRQILTIYEESGDSEAVTATAARIEAQIAKDNAMKKRRATVKARGSRVRGVRSVMRGRPRAMTKSGVQAKTGAGRASVVTERSVNGGAIKAKTGVKRVPSKIMKPHVGRKRI